MTRMRRSTARPRATDQADSVPILAIGLMGEFSLSRSGDAVAEDAWQHPTARTLVKLLAVQAGHQLHREQVIDELWPDADPESVSAQLRKALHAARYALQPDLKARAASDYLLQKGRVVYLSPAHVRTDVDDFRAKATTALRSRSEAHLSAAVGAYAGELLPEDLYEGWAEAPRRELATTFRDLVLHLVSALEARGAQALALQPLRDALAIHPADEELYERLMRLHIRLGSRHSALLTYWECKRVLRDVLGVEPSDRIEELHDRLVSGVVEGGTQWSDDNVLPEHLVRSETPCVGRDLLLEDVRSLFAPVSQGESTLLLLDGEAGIGKTRLATEIAKELHGAGAIVLWGNCFEEERRLPYSVFREAMNGYLSSIQEEDRPGFLQKYEDLLPLLLLDDVGNNRPQDEAAQEQEALIRRGIHRFLSDLSLDRPLILVLEDLHLADPSSLLLLRHLTRTSIRMPWLLLCTYRSEAAGQTEALTRFIRWTQGQRMVHHIEVPPLDEPDCRRLSEMLLVENAPSGGLLTAARMAGQVYSWSLGNPLFTVELVDMLRQGKGLDSGSDVAGLPRVRQVVEERLDRLTDLSRRTIDLACVAGMQWPFKLIFDALLRSGRADVSESSLLEALDAALAAGVVQEVAVGQSWGYSFRHPLVQAVLYDALSTVRRTRFHRLLGQTIEDLTPEEVEVLAYHFSRSDDADRAVKYLYAAGRRALGLYAHEAAALYFEELLLWLDSAGRSSEKTDVRLALGKLSDTRSA